MGLLEGVGDGEHARVLPRPREEGYADGQAVLKPGRYADAGITGDGSGRRAAGDVPVVAMD